ncbi:MAG: hypothetical protein IPK80_02365 [Nannocystis sp.]|nr:hypothetical protein [Nannocystis sp.]
MFQTQTIFKHFIPLKNKITYQKIWVELDSIVAISELWEDGKFSSTELYLRDIEPSRASVCETGEEILRKMQSAVSDD